ncbi:MAG: YfhO family protein [Candidatus Curtissbacteria bacterium]
MKKLINSWIFPVLFFFALNSIIFFPIFLGKVNINSHFLVSFFPLYGENLAFKLSGLDQLRLYYPAYHFMLEEFGQVSIPLWNPYAFSGQPNVANLQSAVFYPLNLFGFFMPFSWFWNLMRFSPSLLAAFFTYLYLRHLGLSKISGFFGALGFGFSPFILVWGEEQVITPHSVIWLPLIFFAVERFLSGKRKRLSFALISLSVACSIFAGFIQTTIYMLLFSGVYIFYRCGYSKIRQAAALLGALVLGVAMSAIQLIPTIELYFLSARAEFALKETLNTFLLPPEALLTYLAPDFFGNPATYNFFRSGAAQYYEGVLFAGVGILIFATFALSLWRKNKLTVFFFIIFAITLSTAVDLPTSRLLSSLPIPIIGSSIAVRILFVPVFCLAVMAAIGLELWLKSKEKLTKALEIIALFYLVLIFVLLIYKAFQIPYFWDPRFAANNNLKVSFRNLVVPIFIFGSICAFGFLAQRQKVSRQLVAIVIIGISFAHISLFAQKFFSFSDEKYLFPKIPVLDFIVKNQGNFRSWGIGDAFLENNFATAYGINFPEGYNSLSILSYSQFTQAMQGVSLDDFVSRADAGVGRDRVDLLLPNPNRRKLIDILGIRYVIGKNSDAGLLEKNDLKRVFEDSDFSVFENGQVMPRVFLASRYEKVTERERIIPRLLADDFDMRESLILEHDSPISPQAGEGGVEVLSYRSGEVIIKTKSEAPKLLFISDNFYPGWKAKVDGDETAIMRADYTFRAVPLLAGEHTVRFYFDSDSFKWGALISLLSLGVLFVFTSGRIRLRD